MNVILNNNNVLLFSTRFTASTSLHCCIPAEASCDPAVCEGDVDCSTLQPQEPITGDLVLFAEHIFIITVAT